MIYADRDERLRALRVAANVLRDRFPITRETVHIVIGMNRLEAHAALLWPGVVRVSMRYTGELVAQSVPGKPYELDMAAS